MSSIKTIKPEYREFRKLSHDEFLHLVHKFGQMTRDEIKAYLLEPATTMFELTFGKMIVDAANGNDKARQFLCDRLWGRAREYVEIAQSSRERAATISTQELAEIYKLARGIE